MRITVHLHSTLGKFQPPQGPRALELEVNEGATVADVIVRLGIPPRYTPLAVSAERQLAPAAVLHDGQQIDLFPPLVGGS